MRFQDRHDAGRRLARMLEPIIRGPAVVYALPRGGVPVAAEIALALRMPLDLVVARKVGHPARPEYAVCAVTETGEALCDPSERAHLDPVWVANRINAERAEALRRREDYGRGHPRRRAHGMCAVLVDDGVATGLSLEAALREIRADTPRRVIVAVPVAPAEVAARFRSLCDEFVALQIPESFAGAVGAYYEDFSPVSDDQVLREMARAQTVPRADLRHTEA